MNKTQRIEDQRTLAPPTMAPELINAIAMLNQMSDKARRHAVAIIATLYRLDKDVV
ncbi:MAG: hypothetical protein JO253_04765 [Alphaproteobacteria bacterium]|nr:hypothetical protein [Alphaproteobacteria bacterium]